MKKFKTVRVVEGFRNKTPEGLPLTSDYKIGEIRKAMDNEDEFPDTGDWTDSYLFIADVIEKNNDVLDSFILNDYGHLDWDGIYKTVGDSGIDEIYNNIFPLINPTTQTY